jgi:hypothetical protein
VRKSGRRDLLAVAAGARTPRTALAPRLLLSHGRAPGKSGSVFFLSADDQLLVKTIRKQEARLLRALLPRYYDHMMSHPNSLLVRVMGMFSITSESSGGRKVGRNK